MSSPISCRSISTVNQIFYYLVVNLLTLSLVVRKVSLIAISLISFGNENLHIYNGDRPRTSKTAKIKSYFTLLLHIDV